jgi:hypothetical protein
VSGPRAGRAAEPWLARAKIGPRSNITVRRVFFAGSARQRDEDCAARVAEGGRLAGGSYAVIDVTPRSTSDEAARV